LGGASVNLIQRALRSEPAYPGLRQLIAAFYSAIAIGGLPPIAFDAIIDVAAARDQLLRRLRGSAT
jgi:hypothetical protein